MCIWTKEWYAPEVVSCKKHIRAKTRKRGISFQGHRAFMCLLNPLCTKSYDMFFFYHKVTDISQNTISFFCQKTHSDWLTKEYISSWFLVLGAHGYNFHQPPDCWWVKSSVPFHVCRNRSVDASSTNLQVHNRRLDAKFAANWPVETPQLMKSEGLQLPPPPALHKSRNPNAITICCASYKNVCTHDCFYRNSNSICGEIYYRGCKSR